MKYLNSPPLTTEFFEGLLGSWAPEDETHPALIEELLAGMILLEKPSPRKIHDELLTEASQRTFYREIHALAEMMPTYYGEIVAEVQKDSRMQMRTDGLIAIDEHIIIHSSPGIEGVGNFYSTTERGLVLGHFLIFAHYFRRDVEYPVMFRGYRKEVDLIQSDKEEEFEKKNAIARDIISDLCDMPTCPRLFLMDSYFMTKENAKLLQDRKRAYVSRPKRSWKGSIDKTGKKDLGEIFDLIPPDEFQPTVVKNPKTRKCKTYQTAVRNIFFAKIGFQRVVFIDCDLTYSEQDLIEKVPEFRKFPSTSQV